MHEFAVMDHEKGWAFQMHIGAMRNNNTKMYRSVGPDTGFDSIGDSSIARPLVRFLDRLEQKDQLPKTILYNLNSSDNEVLASWRVPSWGRCSGQDTAWSGLVVP
jgi:glucuronate isomerase